MDLTLVLVGILGLIGLVFVLTHLRPLNEDELRQLGEKKREKQIREYFSFATGEFSVNKEFKKRMNPNGKFYQINESLFDFPPIAAALLKYKKHEWIIVAFENEQKIDLIWLNKGFDRYKVSLYLPIKNIANIAGQENRTSVLIFHNHPNSDPYYHDCSKPSSQDLDSANEFSRVLNTHGINLVEFVCERGIHYQYFSSYANTFLPLSNYVEMIDKINGLSKLRNLSLHIERIF